MAVIPNAFISADEIASRVGRLQAHYAGNPIIREISYRIGRDWSEDPAVFLDVTVPPGTTAEELLPVANQLREDVLTLMRTDELGLHTYVSFPS